jgi:Abnormal spindle-like microcephaly-assoc'd, ASPM-SPD-2-Hydin
VFEARGSISSKRRPIAGAVLCAILILVTGCAGNGPKLTPSTLSVSASAFDFKTVAIGQTANQNLTITNSGHSPVQVTGLKLSNKEFAITGPSVPRTILPANSLSYTVSFSPTTSGSAAATLAIKSDVMSDSVSLAGSGEKAFADLILTPPAINFGNLALQKTSTQNVTMQNTGDVNITLQGITVAGAGFGYSSLSPGFSLAPNQKVTFQVWFSPKVAGAAAAKVTFLSPNLSSPQTMALTGDGVSSTGSTPPSAPASHTVQLNWNASTTSVVGYRVYRSEVSGGSYSPLNGTAIKALSYDDTTVSLGTTYYYVVTAVDASGNESVQSNQATAAIPAT